MERPLQLLHLHQDFYYRRLPTDKALPEHSPSMETIELYELAPRITTGSEGPRLSGSLPSPPLYARIGPKEDPEAADFTLHAGEWLFRQREDAPDGEMAPILEAFLRDAWWEGRRAGDTLIVRRVWEDGKTALQIWAVTVTQGAIPAPGEAPFIRT